MILIGADVPDLAPHHLRTAAAALESHLAVISPAENGGYWLLGLRALMPFLFAPMAWGTDGMFAESLVRFAAHGIAPAVLERLADLGRPDDLLCWSELAA